MKKTMIISLCFIAIMMTGCGSVAKIKNGEEIVAAIKGTTITADTLYKQMKSRYAKDLLINMIDKTILDTVYKTDETMTTTINNQISSYKEQLGDNFLATVKSQLNLDTEAELFDYLLLNYKKNEATKAFVKKNITEAEINNYYATTTVGDIKASHILIKPNVTDSMTDEQKTAKENEALNLAKQIITKLNNGEKFADLAKKYSSDGSASKGGDLGWFNKGDMVAAFEDAAYALEKGKYTTTPVKSDYGYHVILKTDLKAKAALKDVRDDIIDSLVTSKLSVSDNTYQTQALIALRKEYKLDIKDSEVKAQYDAYMKELLK